MNSQRVLVAELLAELRALHLTMTEYAARLGGRAVNNVLGVETFAIPTDGYVNREYGVAAGAVDVSNPGNNIVVVVAGGASSPAAPGTGVGVYRIPAGTARTVNVGTHQIGFYGTAADVVSIQVFAKGAEPVT
jgi:hypothetical protein